MTTRASLKAATGPMRSRTMATSSRPISASAFVTPDFSTTRPQRHLPLQRIAHADHGAFGNIGMRGQHLLHRAGGQAVARDVDDVVGADMITQR
jgi:hypothetical protein